jgi:hypothetical protein
LSSAINEQIQLVEHIHNDFFRTDFTRLDASSASPLSDARFDMLHGGDCGLRSHVVVQIEGDFLVTQKNSGPGLLLLAPTF